MKKTLSGLIALTAALTLCGCAAATDSSSAQESTSSAASSQPEQTAQAAESAEAEADAEAEAELKSDVLADLTGTYDDVSTRFEFSDGWSNGSMFNCTWRKRNGKIFDGSMKLTIDLDGNGLTEIPYSGAEFRSRDFYGYGMYEVVMKPIKNDGVVSSFFTYTGPSDNNPWDEIDIEFLGKDTTIVQFNYFTNGRGNHEFIYELGFDAAEDFHTYGFDWQEDSITWYVDGEAVYTATENIPTTPGKIMMNVWPGKGVDGWLKAFDGTVPLTAEYRSANFTPAGQEG